MRRNDVTSTSFRRRVSTRFLINQCQIITFLILKYDIIENSRIELRGIVLPVQVGGLLGGGGAKGMLAPPRSQIIGGGWPPLAPPPLFLRLWCNNTLTRIRNVIDNVRVNSASLIEIMLHLKAIKSHLKESYDKQDLTLVVILYEIYETRRRLVS